MKKIVVVFAMLALVIGSVFAADISASVEIGTGLKFNIPQPDKSEYLYGPNYGDVGLTLSIESEMYGANIGFGAGDLQSEFEMYDTNAWMNFGSFAKVQIGDFSNSAANADYVLSVVDEYDLGILRYGTASLLYHEPDAKGFNGDYVIAGDKLKNLVVDFYAGSATIQLAWMTPVLPAAEGTTLNFGGRVATSIGDFVDLTFTATYYDFEGLTKIEKVVVETDKDGNVVVDINGSVKTKKVTTRDAVEAVERTTIGAFVGFPELGALLGYTASIVMSDDNRLEHGIDLRIDIPLGDIMVGTHNNLSLYGDKKMVVYNEVGAAMNVTEDVFAKLRVRSHYYDDGAYKAATDNKDPETAYTLGIYLGLDFSLTESSMISTGIDVNGIASTVPGDELTVAIPVTFKVWF